MYKTNLGIDTHLYIRGHGIVLYILLYICLLSCGHGYDVYCPVDMRHVPIPLSCYPQHVPTQPKPSHPREMAGHHLQSHGERPHAPAMSLDCLT